MSAAACPETMIPGWTVSATRPYCSISAEAARATSPSGTGSLHLRTGSSPASTSRFSELRRIRVTRWSMEKRWESCSESVLVLLEVVDHPRQPVDQRHAAPRQADEHRVEVAAQLRLGAGQPHRLGVDLVERAGHAGDLVGALHADRLDVAEGSRVRLGQVGPAGGGRHPRGQPDGGDLERVRLQPAQRVDHRPGDQRGRQQHQQHHGHGHHGGQHRRLERLSAAAAGCAARPRPPAGR